MKTKRILSLLFVLVLMVVCIFAPFLHKNMTDRNEIDEKLIPKATVIEHKAPVVKYDEIESDKKKYDDFNLYIELQNEIIQEEIKQINTSNRKEWFIEFKKIIENNSDVLEPPETIYNYFTEEELDKLFRVVEAEATAGGFNEKANVVSVIFNRMSSKEFANVIDEVLVESEFSPLSDGRWQKVEITEDTILACEYVFMIGSTVEDAVFFDATNGNSWASNNKEFVMNDGMHSFYR